MKVLIIGGAGYIGSHQVKMMCDKGYDVVVVDNLSTGYKESVDKRATFKYGDIRNFEFIKSVLVEFNIEAVIHFAALSLVGVSTKEPLDYYDNNVYGMQVLLKAMAETGVNKIVFSSTAATYGDVKTMPIKETVQENPVNPYGETKLAMEKMIKWSEKAYGIKYIALRYFNAAGASLDSSIGENHNPETHLIPIVLQVALNKRESISVFGNDYDTKDGTCIRDYIHVLDLCSAHILAVEALKEGHKSDIYNLGYSKGTSVLEIIEETERVTGCKIKYTIEGRREGDPAKLVASNDKIVNDLGWKPQYDDLGVIIESAYNYYKKIAYN